jgi:putative transposase
MPLERAPQGRIGLDLRTYEVTKCASGQAIMAAFANFLRDCKEPRKQRRFRYPRFKKKALNESFALSNDQFAMSGNQVRIAKLGFVRMREELRFAGRSWAPPYRSPAIR